MVLINFARICAGSFHTDVKHGVLQWFVEETGFHYTARAESPSIPLSTSGAPRFDLFYVSCQKRVVLKLLNALYELRRNLHA